MAFSHRLRVGLAVGWIGVSGAFDAGATDLSEIKFETRARVSVPHPSFLTLAPAADPGLSPELLVSSFKLLGKDGIYRLRDMPAALKGGTPSVETLSQAITWPNEVTPLEASELGRAGYLVASGFLLPTKSTGALSFLDAATGGVFELTAPKSGFFYHRAVFADVSGTGRMDIIAARGRIPLFGGKPEGELVWLRRPADPLSTQWGETVLAHGPDIHFRLAHEPVTGRWIVLAAEFGGHRLSAHWIGPEGLRASRVIDDTLGSPFDLELVDLDRDGREDLLVTNHQGDARAAVFAYAAPADWMTGKWERHTLLAGIETRQKGFNQASPGAAKAFFPVLARKDRERPWIVVSGDGSQRLHLLTPESEATGDWRYRESILLDAKSTVCEPLVHDFDGDGYADIAVPAYDSNLLYLISARPAPKGE